MFFVNRTHHKEENVAGGEIRLLFPEFCSFFEFMLSVFVIAPLLNQSLSSFYRRMKLSSARTVLFCMLLVTRYEFDFSLFRLGVD